MNNDHAFQPPAEATKPYKISPEHHAQIKAAAERDPDCMAIFKRMEEQGFDIDPNMTETQKAIHNYDVYFLYPNTIQFPTGSNTN